MAGQEPSATEMDEMRFLGLVDMLASQALMALGKIADPTTGKPMRVALDHARIMIDLLEMLERKTKGNITDREKRMLEMQLTNLRLNFVDEMNRQKAGGGAAADEDEDEDEDEDLEDEDDDDEDQDQVDGEDAGAKPGDAEKKKKEEVREPGFVDKRSGR